MTTAITKYWFIAVLTAIISGLTYVMNEPMLTSSTIIGAVILVLGLIVHDLESPSAVAAS